MYFVIENGQKSETFESFSECFRQNQMSPEKQMFDLDRDRFIGWEECLEMLVWDTYYGGL